MFEQGDGAGGQIGHQLTGEPVRNARCGTTPCVAPHIRIEEILHTGRALTTILPYLERRTSEEQTGQAATSGQDDLLSAADHLEQLQQPHPDDLFLLGIDGGSKTQQAIESGRGVSLDDLEIGGLQLRGEVLGAAEALARMSATSTVPNPRLRSSNAAWARPAITSGSLGVSLSNSSNSTTAWA